MRNILECIVVRKFISKNDIGLLLVINNTYYWKISYISIFIYLIIDTVTDAASLIGTGVITIAWGSYGSFR